MRSLALLLVALVLPLAAQAQESSLRLGVEGGAMSAFDGVEGVAPVGSAWLRVALGDRLGLDAGLALRRSILLVPVLLDLRLDTGPIEPHLGAGLALARVGGEETHGVFGAFVPVVQIGADLPIGGRFAVGLRIVHAGLGFGSPAIGSATLYSLGVAAGI